MLVFKWRGLVPKLCTRTCVCPLEYSTHCYEASRQARHFSKIPFPTENEISKHTVEICTQRYKLRTHALLSGYDLGLSHVDYIRRCFNGPGVLLRLKFTSSWRLLIPDSLDAPSTVACCSFVSMLFRPTSD